MGTDDDAYAPSRQRRLVLTPHRTSDGAVFAIELAGVQEYDLDDEGAARRELVRIAKAIAEDVLGARLWSLQASYDDLRQERSDQLERMRRLEMALDQAAHERRRAQALLAHAAALAEELAQQIRSMLPPAPPPRPAYELEP